MTRLDEVTEQGGPLLGGRSGPFSYAPWNSANHELFYGKDGDLTGSDKESQEVSMPALHLLQSAFEPRTAPEAEAARSAG
ncbi:hypothetical protein [Streptomyces sp. NPDC052292]|uniref:hypothetical protein n=1 Tax=Streptomyces sp. NPDC052292 TaxID=3155053 RepID=UPI0034434044